MASRQRAPTSKPSDLFDDDVDQEHDQFEIMDDDEFMQRSVEDLRQRHAELRDALKAIGSSQRKAKLNDVLIREEFALVRGVLLGTQHPETQRAVQGVIETCNVLAMDWEAAQTAAADGGTAQRRKGMQPVQILARALRWLEGEPLQDVFEAEMQAGGLGGVLGGIAPPSPPPSPQPAGQHAGSAASLRSSSATPSELDAHAPAPKTDQVYPSRHPSPPPLTPLPESFTAPLRVLTLNNYAAILVRTGNVKKAMSILRLVRAAAGVYNAEVAQWAAAFAEKSAEYAEWHSSTSADRAEYDQAMADIAGVQSKWDSAVARREAALRRRVAELLGRRADRLQRAAQRYERRMMADEDLAATARRHAERVGAYRFAKGAHQTQVREIRAAYAMEAQVAKRRAASWDERRKEAREKAAERAAHLERKAVRQEEQRQRRIAELAKSPLRKAADSERVDFRLVNPLATDQLVPAARCLWKRDPTLPRVRERDEHGLKRLVAGSLPLSGKVKILVKSARRVQPPITRAPGPGEWGYRRVTYLYVQARIGDVVSVTTAKPAKVDTVSHPLPGAYPAAVLRGTDKRDLDMNVYIAKWKQVVELSLHSGLNAAQHLHLALLSRTEFEPVLGGEGGSLADSAAVSGMHAPTVPPPPQEKDIILGSVTISMRSLVSRAMDKAIDVATVQMYKQFVEVGHAVNATTPLSWLKLARQLKSNNWNGKEVMEATGSPRRLGAPPDRDGGPFGGGEEEHDRLFISGELECGYGWQPDAEVLGGVLFRAAAEAAGGHGPDGEPLPGYEYLTGIPLGGATPEGLDAYMVKALTAAPPPAPAMGMLKVLVQQARKLVYPGTGKEVSASYLVARVGGSVARTKIVRNTNKPLWNEVLEIQIPTGFIDTAHLELRLYDQELSGSSVSRSGSSRAGSASGDRPRHHNSGSLATEDDAVGVVRIRLQDLMLGCIMEGTRHVEDGKRSKLAKLHAVEEAKWYNIRATGAALPADWKQQAAAHAEGAPHSDGGGSDDDRSLSRGGSTASRGGERSSKLKPPRIGKVQLGYGWRPNREALEGYILRVQDWVRTKAAATAALNVDDELEDDGESSVETLDEETRALAEDKTTGAQVYPKPRAPPHKSFRLDPPGDMRSVASVSTDTQYSRSLSDIMLAVRQAQSEDPLEGLGARPVPPHLPLIPPQPEVPPPPPAMAPLTQTHLNLTAILSSVGRHGPALASAQSAVQECRRELRGARGLCETLQGQVQEALEGGGIEDAEGGDNMQIALGTAWGACAGGGQQPVAPGWRPSTAQLQAALHAAQSTLVARRTALAIAYHALAIQLEHCGHPIQSVRHFQRAAQLGKRATELPEEVAKGGEGGVEHENSDDEAAEQPPSAEGGASGPFAGDLMDRRVAAMLERDFNEAAKLHRVEVDRKGAIIPAPRLKRNEYLAAAQAEEAAAVKKALAKAKATARREAEARGEEPPPSEDEGGSDGSEGGGEDDTLGDAVSVDSFQPYVGPPAFKEHHAPAHKLLKVTPEEALGVTSIRGTTARRKIGTAAGGRRGKNTTQNTGMGGNGGSASTLALRGMSAGIAAASMVTGQPAPEDKDGMLARAAAIVVDVPALRREWGAGGSGSDDGDVSDSLSEESEPHGYKRGMAPPAPLDHSQLRNAPQQAGARPFAVEEVDDVSPGFRPPPPKGARGAQGGSVQARLQQGVQRAERSMGQDGSSTSLQAAALASGVPHAALRGDGRWATTTPSAAGGGAWGVGGGSSRTLLPGGKRSAGLGGSEPLDPETMAFVHRVLSHSHDEHTQSQIVQAYFSTEIEELQEQMRAATARSQTHLAQAKRTIRAAKGDCGITATYALRMLAAADAWQLLPQNTEQGTLGAPSPGGTTPVMSPPAPGFQSPPQAQAVHGGPSVHPPMTNSRGFASRSLVASPVRRSPDGAAAAWPGDEGGSSADEGPLTDVDEDSVHEPMSSQSTLPEYRRQQPRGGGAGSWGVRQQQESKASLGTSASNDSLHGRMESIFGRSEADALIGSYGMTDPAVAAGTMVAPRPAPSMPRSYAPVAGSRAGTFRGRRVVSTSPVHRPAPDSSAAPHKPRGPTAAQPPSSRLAGNMQFAEDDMSFLEGSDGGASDVLWGDSSDAQLSDHRWAHTAQPGPRGQGSVQHPRSATAGGGYRGASQAGPGVASSVAFSAHGSPGQQAAARSRKQGNMQAAVTKAQVRSRRDARRAEAEHARWHEEHQWDVPDRPPVPAHDSDSDERPISHRELFLQPVAAPAYSGAGAAAAAQTSSSDSRSVSPIASGPTVRWSDK